MIITTFLMLIHKTTNTMTVTVKNATTGAIATVILDTPNSTFGTLLDKLDATGNDTLVPPGSKVVVRHTRQELSAGSHLPTDRDTITLNVFPSKLDSGI